MTSELAGKTCTPLPLRHPADVGAGGRALPPPDARLADIRIGWGYYML